MTRHPLASLLVKQVETKRNFAPLSTEQVLYSSSPSSHFEKIGLLILAGGRGSRLGFEGAKGLVDLGGGKTLFSLLFEKLRKKEKDSPLFVAIMTSPLNHEEVLAYFEKNRWFGKEPSSIDIFLQNTLPIADEEGNLLLDEKGEEIHAPNGNGEALFRLHALGILDKWEEKGVEMIQVLPIDNLFANPFNEELLGAYEAFGDELIVQAITREDAEEKIGVLCLEKNQLSICEYSEISEEMKKDLSQFPLGYSGLFACSVEFVKRLAEQKITLPYHVAKKKRGEKSTYQFERFIFDLFPYAQHFKILSSDRKKIFFPIKTVEDLARARLFHKSVKPKLKCHPSPPKLK